MVRGAAFFLTHFSLMMLLIAVIVILVHWKMNRKASCSEIAFRWLILLPVGLANIYMFVIHAAYPEIAASLVGWANSPFQFEVAIADLGFGLIAILAFKASYGFRSAAVIGNTCWLWGNAVGHIHMLIAEQDYLLAHAGSWLWMDILLPLLLIIYLNRLGVVGSSRRK